jgi:O-antigen/teichoic acid export membrane protein
MSPEDDRGTEEDAPRGLAGRVVRGAGMAAGGYAMAQGLNLAFYLVLARLIAPEEFGAFAAATVLLGFLGLVTDSGMTSALIHREDRMEEALSTATVSTLIGGTLLSLAALAVSPAIGFFFDSSKIEALAAAMSGIVLLRTIVSVPSAILQRSFSFRRRMIVEPAQVVAFGAISVACAAGGMGAWALVAGQYGGAVADVLLSWLLVSFRPRLRQVSFAMWRELASYGRHILFATVILRAGETSDTVIVGKVLGEGPLGQFRYAVRLATTPFQLLLAAAAYVLFPAFARISGERERFHGAFLRSLRWMSVLGFPSGLILVPLGVPLAVLLFGDVWRDAGYAAMGMGLFTGASSLSSVASEALKADGRPDRLTRMHTMTAIVTVLAMLALVPLGLSAVAIGLSIGAAVGGTAGMVYVVRLMAVERRDVLREIWPPLVAALTMAAVMTPVEFLVVKAADRGTGLGLLLLVAEAAAAALVYLAALAVLAPPVARELVGGARSLRGTLSTALRGAPDEEALDEAEAPLPGNTVQ